LTNLSPNATARSTETNGKGIIYLTPLTSSAGIFDRFEVFPQVERVGGKFFFVTANDSPHLS